MANPPSIHNEIDAKGNAPEFAQAAFNPDYDQHRAACLARHDHALLDDFYARRQLTLSGRSQILEFGCELTWGSLWLAGSGRFAVVETTPQTLQISVTQAKQRGLRDIQFALLRNIGDLDALAPCDLFYSALSLKRLPPTTVSHILSLLLTKVTTGGVALVHAPTRHRHEALMIDNDKNDPERQIIPQWTLSQLFKQLGFEIALIQETTCYRSSDIVYHTFLAERLLTPEPR